MARQSKKAPRPNTFAVSALAVAISMGCHSALGQDQRVEELEEITVTGSRIRQTSGMTTPVPITAITQDELTTFDPGGTIAEQLDVLPQFFGNRSAQNSTGAMNFGSGSSFLDLRNLGSNRTLVLFDGSRVVPASMSGVVGIDTFPTALIRTVDVVTGGASAAYGADALGGVVNFVLDREFEGLELEAGTGITEWGDGERWNVSAAGGTRIGERLNIIGSVEAREIEQILRAPEELDTDWWQNWGWVTNPAWSRNAPPGVPARLTLPWVASTEHTPTGMIWSRDPDFPLSGYTFTDDGRAVRPFVKGDVYALGRGTTNTLSGGPEGQIANRATDSGPYGAGTKQRSAFLGLQYGFSDSVTGFAQLMMGRAETLSLNRRSDYVLRSRWAATIYRDNAYLPAEVAQAMDAAGIDSFELQKAGAFIGDNNIGLGDGREVFDILSLSAGLDVVLPNGWDLRASWQSGESENLSGLYGQTRIDRMFLGMDAVRDPETGAIVCRVQLFNPSEAELAAAPSIQGRESVAGGSLLSPIGLDNTVRDCVPYNIFGAGNMSDQAVAYTQSPREQRNKVEQDFVELLLTGELHEGWGYGPVGLAAGLTWREQSFRQTMHSSVYHLGPPQNAPELGIRGIAPGYTGGSETLHRFTSARDASGEMGVWEWFGEMNFAFWQSASAAQRLNGSLAYRSSDYDRSGRIESWKAGLDFQVFEDLRLRATRSRDVREPTFQELYNNRGGGGGTITDPVNGTTYLTTVTANGNPNLRPEVADTVVAGLVYQPSWLPGLQLSSDWYEVDVKDSVGSLSAQRIVDDCAEGAAGFCSSIERGNDGLIVKINNGFLNVDQARVEGVDIEALYAMEPDFFGGGFESLRLRLLGGYIIERSDTPLGGAPRDVSGEIGTPDFTAIATLAYNVGPWGLNLQQRYIADTIRDIDWVEGVDVDDNSVSSGNYTNLRLGYSGEMVSGATWNASVNLTNLFDRPPPIVAGNGGQSIPNGYDQYGRRYQLSVNLNF